MRTHRQARLFVRHRASVPDAKGIDTIHTMRRIVSGACFLAFLTLQTAFGQADLVLVGGKVFTTDAGGASAQAAVLRGGRLIFASLPGH